MDKDKVFIEKITSYYTSLQRGKQNPTKRVVKVTFVITENPTQTFVITENPTQRVARLYNKRKKRLTQLTVPWSPTKYFAIAFNPIHGFYVFILKRREKERKATPRKYVSFILDWRLGP